MPGEVSQILECELVDDGGYVYSLFNLVGESDFVEETTVNPSKAFKQIMQLEPNMSQIALNDDNVDYTKTAASQVDNLLVGTAGEDLWNKRFKVRLTSKKTGKKLDINVRFNIQTQNLTMSPVAVEEVLD